MDLEFILLIILGVILFTVPCFFRFFEQIWKPFIHEILITLGCRKRPSPPERVRKKRGWKGDHLEHHDGTRMHEKEARLERAKNFAWEPSPAKKKKRKKKGPYKGSKVTPLPMIKDYPLEDFMGLPQRGPFIGPRAGAFDLEPGTSQSQAYAHGIARQPQGMQAVWATDAATLNV
eukprot:g6657.t1